jgi:superfamily II DNA or RNA helicase
MPLHQHARKLHEGNFFTNLNNFKELESKIEDLPTALEKGAAFEVFAEAYIATQKDREAEIVWPNSHIPMDLRDQLNLTRKDNGVDGVYKTHLKKNYAYQVKFRSKRQSLPWGELGTFFGQTDNSNIACRVIFTNSDDIAGVAENRDRYFSIRGTDLDRLERADFSQIASWLDSKEIPRKRKDPMLHQQEALNNILNALQTENRVTAIMACGTGKTLVTLWAAEKHASDRGRILVLLPSLALLRQTLHEWLKETKLPKLACLCVCSDATVSQVDSYNLKQSDLDFPVTTDSNIIRNFLNEEYEGTKFIFSTYHSTEVIKKALGENDKFDFGIFDEAHKTAGREGRAFSLALNDEEIPITKRLFVTATPRHYKPYRKKADEPVFSMDNPDVYGKQAYKLSFKEASEKKLICNYKIIISIITSENLSNDEINHGTVNINGDDIKARQVANQISLKSAINKYGIKKVFTFHKNVDSAKSFVAEGNEGIQHHLEGLDFRSFHVNGTMPTSEREIIMREFRETPRAVISNARCLTEGVDVPAVDLVAFLSPKRSRVDIVQATGRAMRKAEGKECGYILLPLYVEIAQDESIQSAVARANFTEILDILQSHQEQDEILADLIRSVGENSNILGHNDNSQRVEFLTQDNLNLDLEQLKTAVATQCFKPLYSTWDSNFAKLKAYKDYWQHCNVPAKWEGDPQLASWVSQQRTQGNCDRLDADKKQRLISLGFDFKHQRNKRMETWMGWYSQLEAYKLKHGNLLMNQRGSRLGRWVMTQIRANTAGELEDSQKHFLEDIKFPFDPVEARWNNFYEKLVMYHKNNRDSLVGTREGDCSVLSAWVKQQRASKDISEEKKRELNDLGFIWDINAYNWEQNYQQLEAYNNDNCHCNVPSGWKENPVLASWVSAQRTQYKNNELTKEKIEKLSKLSFVWELRKRGTWEDSFHALKEYKEANHRFPTMNQHAKLARFINSCRVQYNRNEMPSERIAMLEAIGFEWSAR